MYRTGITSFAFIPLSAVNPEGVTSLIGVVAKHIDGAKKEGKLPPGLAEQLDIQLESLKGETCPGFEFVAFPNCSVPASKCDATWMICN